MAIETLCPHCRCSRRMIERDQGKRLHCTHCGRTFGARAADAEERGRRRAVVWTCLIVGAVLLIGGLVLFLILNGRRTAGPARLPTSVQKNESVARKPLV